MARGLELRVTVEGQGEAPQNIKKTAEALGVTEQRAKQLVSGGLGQLGAFLPSLSNMLQDVANQGGQVGRALVGLGVIGLTVGAMREAVQVGRELREMWDAGTVFVDRFVERMERATRQIEGQAQRMRESTGRIANLRREALAARGAQDAAEAPDERSRLEAQHAATLALLAERQQAEDRAIRQRLAGVDLEEQRTRELAQLDLTMRQLRATAAAQYHQQLRQLTQQQAAADQQAAQQVFSLQERLIGVIERQRAASRQLAAEGAQAAQALFGADGGQASQFTAKMAELQQFGDQVRALAKQVADARQQGIFTERLEAEITEQLVQKYRALEGELQDQPGLLEQLRRKYGELGTQTGFRIEVDNQARGLQLANTAMQQQVQELERLQTKLAGTAPAAGAALGSLAQVRQELSNGAVEAARYRLEIERLIQTMAAAG